VVGQFQIHVTTSYQGAQASLNIPQSNGLTVAATAGTSTAKLIAIIGGIAAAGGIATAVALTRGGTPSGTISLAGAQLGAPR